jgi:plastocyanin
MTPEEIAALKPGDRVRWVPTHSRGYRNTGNPVVTLARRKDDGSGWWNTDGSGLDDRLALATDSWEVVR